MHVSYGLGLSQSCLIKCSEEKLVITSAHYLSYCVTLSLVSQTDKYSDLTKLLQVW